MIAFFAEPTALRDPSAFLVQALALGGFDGRHGRDEMRCALCVFGKDEAGRAYGAADREVVSRAFSSLAQGDVAATVVYAGREPGEPARMALRLFGALADAACAWSLAEHGVVLVCEHACEETADGTAPVHCHVLASPAAGFADAVEAGISPREGSGAIKVVRG